MTNRVLSSIDRKTSEVGRLIQNEEYVIAFGIIESLKRNLERIRLSISTDTFSTLSDCLSNLSSLCERRGHDVSVCQYRATRIFSGKRGRPALNISREQLELFVRENYSAKKMAEHFGCSINHIYNKCYSLGLKFRDKYSNCTDMELREEISELHNEFPNSGSQMMIGYLKARGKVVQRKKVRQILADIDPIGTATLWSSAINRRSYSVPTPNSLWHMDANLKLIRWKFAIHGCIDGFSRLILYVRCNTSMTAGGVIPFFASAIVDYGVPSRVRSDCGYENLFAALIMNAIRGLNRGSHITGRSVHNQRIERLWVDVYVQVISYFRDEFIHLEERGLLNIESDIDIFALQTVYFKSINKKLELFRNAWNLHKIRTAGNRSPQQLWISGMLDNINSSHTATTEIFTEAQDIYSRILNCFEANGIDMNVLIPADPKERSSNLTVQLTVTAQTSNAMSRILETNMSDELKYLEVRRCLET